MPIACDNVHATIDDVDVMIDDVDVTIDDVQCVNIIALCTFLSVDIGIRQEICSRAL